MAAIHPKEESAQQQMHVYNMVQSTLTANLMVLGDKLGLYAALAEHGPISASDLAHRLELSPRYLQEWARQQASAKIITCDDEAEQFWLTEAQKDAMVREYGEEASPFYAMGFMQSLPSLLQTGLTTLPELFKTGKGLPYDFYGDDLACGTCRELGVWLRHNLVDHLKGVDNVGGLLEKGCAVADVGCGCGEAVMIAAAAFPNSTFDGFDISEVALRHARITAKERGLTNVDFINPGEGESDMGEAKYDVVMTHDAIHDMAKPQEVMFSVKKAMKPGAFWVLGDMQAQESHGKNCKEYPFAALMYGVSCHLCLPSSLSAPSGSAGLGTLGLSVQRAKEMLETAGFSDVAVLDWENPINRYYLAKA